MIKTILLVKKVVRLSSSQEIYLLVPVMQWYKYDALPKKGIDPFVTISGKMNRSFFMHLSGMQKGEKWILNIILQLFC